MRVPTMDIRQYNRLLGMPSAVIVDLRDAGDYARGHLPGAKHISYEDLISGAYTPEEKRTYYLYCDNGMHSYEATVYLTERGYHAVNLFGGYRRMKSFT